MICYYREKLSLEGDMGLEEAPEGKGMLLLFFPSVLGFLAS